MSRFPFRYVLPLIVLLACAPMHYGQRPDPCARFAIKLDRIDVAQPNDENQVPATFAEPVSEEAEVIRVETDLVITEFEVRDRNGKRVPGLRIGDFLVEEDGVRQKIETFSYADSRHGIGRSIILVIDYSQSQRPYFETSVNAAKVLVDLLDPIDKMAIVTDDVDLLVDFTSDKARLKHSLDLLRLRVADGDFGKSRQLTALFMAVNELFEAGDKRPVVIFQTDGDEMARLLTERSSAKEKCPGTLRKFSDLKSALERAGTTVYSIIPGIRLDNNERRPQKAEKDLDFERVFEAEAKTRFEKRDVKISSIVREFHKHWAKWRVRDALAIAELARTTGGKYEYLDSPEKAEEVYLRILNEMNERYLIGYYPTNRSGDGERRSIRIGLRPGLPYSVNGKKGYTPRKRSRDR
ncbi:MAG TPA: VWA domain-containing protein [Pyrinomonadaceae bacterium]|nr:VWA domain-containing protein [Pyrinomonadaceae bacterium]